MQGKTTNYEAAFQLLQGDITKEDMTEGQLEYWKRVRLAYKLMIDVCSTGYINGELMQVFNISHTQAWRTIRDTERLFGSFRKADKEIKRHIAEEMAKEAYRMAKNQQDPKVMTSATRAYIEASGVSENDPDLPNFEKIQPSLIVTVLPPGMEDAIQQLLQGGKIDLNKSPETIDVQHEEL